MTDLERELSALRHRAPRVPIDLATAARGEASGLKARRRRAMRTRLTVILVAAIALVTMSFTPPGRAATGWISDLAGVGEEPTLEQVGSVEGSAMVLASGTLSDGTPYEVVTKLITGESSGFGGTRETVCFQVDWPGVNDKGQGGACTDSHKTGEGNDPVLETSGLWRTPRAGRAAIFMGIADDIDVAEVEVFQVDREGNERELPSQLLTVEGEFLERIGGSYPVSIFFAPLDEEVIAAGDDRQAQVSAVAYDSGGNELDRMDAFPSLDCPRDPPSIRLPQPTSIRDLLHQWPLSPAEREAREYAIECGFAPPPIPVPTREQLKRLYKEAIDRGGEVGRGGEVLRLPPGARVPSSPRKHGQQP